MHKIVVPHLTFEGEKIETPVGLSELLEPAWTLRAECEPISDVANGYERRVYKRENGCWTTKYEKKVSEC
ncbi:hypothetical protein [Sporosarcina sp. 6E9]|uniref:hypothetical protein n=1 Tax=Sporosarcina sp. 6E9 TaxID=2819235 RepID=UPI001B30F5BB|nr:hypothetical protein [Sporosarcina sp. 6E9]